MTELRLQIDGYDDSDDRERAELTARLRSELLRANVEQVRRPDAPGLDGAKGSALEWAQLIVTLAGSLPPLLGTISSWVNRHPGVSLTATIDGDSVTLSDATPEERREVLDAWLKRHGA
jgi:Effector Associated Constant Component 1